MRFDLANAPSPAKIALVFPSNATVASSPKLLDRIRWLLRAKHYSIRTEEAYVDWARRFILFHRKRHPDEMGEKEISDFIGKRVRYPERAGTARSQRCRHDDDLHTRPQQTGSGHPKSAGSGHTADKEAAPDSELDENFSSNSR
jgi:integrase-like protein